MSLNEYKNTESNQPHPELLNNIGNYQPPKTPALTNINRSILNRNRLGAIVNINKQVKSARAGPRCEIIYGFFKENFEIS
jgi:hypothetical protein